MCSVKIGSCDAGMKREGKLNKDVEVLHNTFAKYSIAL